MTLSSRFFKTQIELSEEQAQQLQKPSNTGYAVQVHPPRSGNLPETLPKFVKGVQELQSKWLGLRNASPTIAFEIRRVNSQLKFQFTAPSKRLERKIRLHLTTEIPDLSFDDGVHGLPISGGRTIGGGLLTTGRSDWYPLRTEFDEPPINSLTRVLHRHAMQDTDVVVQILFQPVLGRPLRRRWWRRRAYQRIGYLNKEKEKLWGSRSPTPREKRQANAIEDKVGTNRFWTTIRFAVVGAGQYTGSRVKELAGGFNIYEDSDTGQYLDTITIKSLREKPILRFSQAVADREFRGWSRKFQASVPELAALVTLPNQSQENLQTAKP